MRGHIVSDRLLHRLIIQSLGKKSFNLFISFIAMLLSLPLSLFLSFLYACWAGPTTVEQWHSEGAAGAICGSPRGRGPRRVTCDEVPRVPNFAPNQGCPGPPKVTLRHCCRANRLIISSNTSITRPFTRSQLYRAFGYSSAKQ
jgi:hypothetical protein